MITEDEYDRGLHVISCLTCKMTQKYYSELGGANFRLSHMGHNVKEGPLPQGEPAPRKVPSDEQAPVAWVAETPPTPKPAQDVPAQEPPAVVWVAETPPTSKPTEGLPVLLSKLQVDIVSREDEERPSFRVWGLRNGRMEAFMLFFPLDRPDDVRSLLEKRQYVKGSQGDRLLFTWSRGAVVISSEARAKLYPASMVLTPPAQMPEVEAKPTPREKPVEVKPAAEEKPEEVRKPPQVARVPVAPPVIAEKVAEKAVETTKSSAPPKKEEKDAEEEGPLLLAKSSYLQDGDETRKEAVRVSKVLRAFRWNVEPAYMIGVILDNNLSIETNTGVISRTLIKRIENLGYTLIAVNVSREKPNAWFKKKTTVQPHAPGTDSSRLRELERRIDEQARMLDEERRHFDEERAGWQQRFTLLKRLMASMGEPAPTEEGGADPSEAEPEPDLSS